MLNIYWICSSEAWSARKDWFKHIFAASPQFVCWSEIQQKSNIFLRYHGNRILMIKKEACTTPQATWNSLLLLHWNLYRNQNFLKLLSFQPSRIRPHRKDHFRRWASFSRHPQYTPAPSVSAYRACSKLFMAPSIEHDALYPSRDPLIVSRTYRGLWPGIPIKIKKNSY